jgi:hypothetical protein
VTDYQPNDDSNSDAVALPYQFQPVVRPRDGERNRYSDPEDTENKVGSFGAGLRYLHDNRLKGNFESHYKYENIAGLVLLSLFMDSKRNVTAYYCQRRLVRVERNYIITPEKQYNLDPSQKTCAYGGEHGTINAVFHIKTAPCSATYGS